MCLVPDALNLSLLAEARLRRAKGLGGVAANALRAFAATPPSRKLTSLARACNYHWPYCTVTVKFIPWCMVQYSLNVPAVVKGPADLLSPPEKLRLTVGAPASLAGFCVVPSQVPLVIICGAVAVSTSVIDSPFLMVIVVSLKLDAPILTCGPLEMLLSSRIVQAANKMVSRAKLVMTNKNFLYMDLPFKPPWFFCLPCATERNIGSTP